ncbi:MAG TPA: universal stress protein [Woeseiaceae bacterium]|nr:universal stress protein [Woeseiaceae bacterium]
MKEISNILLAIDGDHDDEALLAEVETIATVNRASVTVLSIADPPSPKADRNVAIYNLQRWESQIRSRQLDNLSAALTKKGIAVTIEHASGKAYLEIIRKTLASKYQLVIKPAHKESGILQLFLGGTDIQLLSLCPEPVWVFQPTANRALQKIAVAVDLSPDDAERTALAENLLNWAKHIGTLVGAEIHVINIWSLYREASLRSEPASSTMIDELLRSKEQQHRQWLDEMLHLVGMGDDQVYTHLVKGNAKELIPQIANNLDIDLLIMGTVGRTGAPGFFIGNTADTVLRKVRCSVLAVKPENFLTPVKPATQEIPQSA